MNQEWSLLLAICGNLFSLCWIIDKDAFLTSGNKAFPLSTTSQSIVLMLISVSVELL